MTKMEPRWGTGTGNAKAKPAENPDQKQDVNSNCICNRPKTTVVCKCGFVAEQRRVFQECSEHPKTSYLLDMKACPFCMGTNLQELPPDKNLSKE